MFVNGLRVRRNRNDSSKEYHETEPLTRLLGEILLNYSSEVDRSFKVSHKNLRAVTEEPTAKLACLSFSPLNLLILP